MCFVLNIYLYELIRFIEKKIITPIATNIERRNVILVNWADLLYLNLGAIVLNVLWKQELPHCN